MNYEGRTIGYAIAGVCEEPGCSEKIDLGLYYACGDLEGVFGGAGCGHYFCSAHMYFACQACRQLCARCLVECEKEHDQT